MNKRLFFISIVLSAVVVSIMAFFPKDVSAFVDYAFGFLTDNAGVLYILCAICSFFFVAVGIYKHGNIKLGTGNKKYSDFTWASMMFCTGIGGSMMIFSFVEPLYYLQDTPFEIEPMSIRAYEYAHMYGQFHWGILDWMLCVPLTVFLSAGFYNSKNDTLRIGKSVFRHRILQVLADVFCIFAIMGGVATSMGLSAPVISTIAGNFLLMKNSKILIVGIFVTWFIIYATSVWKGLEKGIKKLSYFNVVIAIVFILAVFIIANPLKVIETEINSLGLLFDNFLSMTFYTDPFGASGFPKRWTVFYWALTMAYLPGLAVFTARISEGRTIKQLIGGMVIYGSLGTMFSFSTLGYYSLKIQKSGVVNLCDILGKQGQSEAIKSVLGTLPGSSIFAGVFAIICLIFMATTIDSSVYAIATISMKDTSEDQTPPRWLRMIWAVVMLIFAALLTNIGGLNTMQTASIITAFPMIVISFIAMYKFLKGSS